MRRTRGRGLLSAAGIAAFNSSTEIRQKIVDGVDWKDMVPNAVYEYIVENGLTEKVIALLNKK